jgi:ribose-phosphate pyrophosphokinase
MVEVDDLTTGATVGRAPDTSLGAEKRLLLVSGRSNRGLAARIGTHLGCEIADVTLEGAGGDVYCRFDESVRGADVFIVQTGSHPVDRNLIELAVMVNAAKLASAKRIAAVVPLFFYARQDKKSRPREPITARLVADLLKVAGVDRVLTMDLHAGQLQGFFDIPVDHMTALPMFAEHFRDLHPPDDLVGVSPDTGRTKLAGRFAEMLGGELVILNKTRPDDGEVSVTAVIGEVEGKIAVMIDDMIDTAGTIVSGAEALKAAGASRVYACATHGMFNGPALERIAGSEIDLLAVTDTVSLEPDARPNNVEVLSVAGLLAETIRNVFADESVSAIFAGENQLF